MSHAINMSMQGLVKDGANCWEGWEGMPWYYNSDKSCEKEKAVEEHQTIV